jgi:hypothetical protein
MVSEIVPETSKLDVISIYMETANIWFFVKIAHKYILTPHHKILVSLNKSVSETDDQTQKNSYFFY